MILVKPSASIEAFSSPLEEEIVLAGRTCYKSEGDMSQKGIDDFIVKIISRGHESVLEHGSITVRFVVDRGVSHELVRHRLASFSQESTRYVNYGKRGGCRFVIPPWTELNPGEYVRPPLSDFCDDDDDFYFMPEGGGDESKLDFSFDSPVLVWLGAMYYAEKCYKDLLHAGWSPQQARSVLPNSTKTEVVMTANPREWRHIFRLRCDKAAHPQMREVMTPLLYRFQERWPSLFGDIIES